MPSLPESLAKLQFEVALLAKSHRYPQALDTAFDTARQVCTMNEDSRDELEGRVRALERQLAQVRRLRKR